MRLTDKIKMDKIVVYGCKTTYPERVNNRNETSDVTNITDIINKLGQLEDLMEKYNFENVEDLDNFIQSCINRIKYENRKEYL